MFFNDGLTNSNDRYSRKSSKTATQWLQRVGIYVNEWQNAPTQVWHAGPFDMELFHGYLQRYMSMTRLRPIPHAHDDEIYPSQSTLESRQSAVSILFRT